MTACGPSSGGDDGEDDGADDATSAADDSGDDNASATSDGDGDGDGDGDASSDVDDGDDGELTCQDFENEDGTALMLSVENTGTVPLFLERNGCGDPLSLRETGSELPAQISFPDCEFPSCESLMAGECSVGCSGGNGGACLQSVVRVDPGATYVREWGGSLWVDRMLPTECAGEGPDTNCAPDCHLQQAAASGTYTLDVVWSGCPNKDPDACECPNGEAICDIEVVGNPPSPMPSNSNVDFAYPDETVPTITIP